VSYSASSAAGREAALVTNTTQRLVTITEHREAQRPRMKWAPAAPPFTDRPQYVADPADPETVIEAVADCGHVLYTAGARTSGALSYTYAVGKRKRCAQCPPPERKPRKKKPEPQSLPYVPGTVYRPEPDEIAVVRLECGETATVARIDGEQTFHGDEPFEFEGETYRATRVYLVPFDGPRCGWYGQGWTETGPKVGNGKHRIDRPVWKEAEQLLKVHRGVYVRVEEQPYYNKTRHTAVSVRPHQE
jgi:hypothetical protein